MNAVLFYGAKAGMNGVNFSHENSYDYFKSIVLEHQATGEKEEAREMTTDDMHKLMSLFGGG